MGNNSTPLNKKLKSYSALAGTLVTAGAANAQVMYTNVSPDATVATGATYSLDLDNNSVVDFVLQVDNGSYGAYVYDYALVVPQAAGNVNDTATTGMTRAHVINDPINSSLLWDSASYGLLALNLTAPFPFATGNFLPATDKYIGCKFMIGTNTHYGWVRIDLNATSTLLTVKDYGYDATPNTQVLCGAMPGAIHENLEATTAIFASENAINVKLGGAVDGFVTVTDVLGHVVAKTNITNEFMTIDINNANSGIYFTTVSTVDGNTFTKKLFVK
jgi:Secretion system C-terminal sorting domain